MVIGAPFVSLVLLLAMQAAAPDGASAVLSAIDARDAAAVEALLAEYPRIMDESSGSPEPSTAGAFVRFLDGCERSDFYLETDPDDPARIALTINWSCAERGTTDSYVWAYDGKIEFVQFGQLVPFEGGDDQ